MAEGSVHVIGAGLAGLAAAVELAKDGRRVVLHELAPQAGGRCRSFFEPALGLTIDNGNHLLLSGNHAARGLLKTIGSDDKLPVPEETAFPFVDVATGERWTLRPNDGAIPWWIFSKARRVPGTRAIDYLPLAQLMRAREGDTIADRLRCDGVLYERLLHPLLLAALNTDPPGGSAMLAGAVLRETLARGGRAYRPLIATQGLGPTFIEPALAYLQAKGAEIRLRHQLRAMEFAGDKVAALDFSEDVVQLTSDDGVILAVPAWVATLMVPDLPAPKAYRAIVNLHYKVTPPPSQPRILGIVNGTAEWLFAFDDHVSVTISAADRFIETDREEFARLVWREIAPLIGADDALPPWAIIKERRATFAATPEENARRPGAATRWRNLFLAGDWTATGLPATIEGAVRSGMRAAQLA